MDVCFQLFKCIPRSGISGSYGLPRWHRGKKTAANAGDAKDVSSIPGSERSTPVFLSGKFYGQRSLQATVHVVVLKHD